MRHSCLSATVARIGEFGQVLPMFTNSSVPRRLDLAPPAQPTPPTKHATPSLCAFSCARHPFSHTAIYHYNGVALAFGVSQICFLSNPRSSRPSPPPRQHLHGVMEPVQSHCPRSRILAYIKSAQRVGARCAGAAGRGQSLQKGVEAV
jgi:hypothetical protein